MPGIVILLFIDKGVTVAHRPTKLSPSRHFRCGLVINECWKKVEYVNRSSTVMTSLLFCFISYLGEMRNLQTWYITCLPKVNIAAWKNKKANYNFIGFAFMLINVPICLRNLSQKSDSIAKCFGWALVDCRRALIIQPLAWSGLGRSRLLRLWCSDSVLTTGSVRCLSA